MGPHPLAAATTLQKARRRKILRLPGVPELPKRMSWVRDESRAPARPSRAARVLAKAAHQLARSLKGQQPQVHLSAAARRASSAAEREEALRIWPSWKSHDEEPQPLRVQAQKEQQEEQEEQEEQQEQQEEQHSPAQPARAVAHEAAASYQADDPPTAPRSAYPSAQRPTWAQSPPPRAASNRVCARFVGLSRS